MKPILIVDDEAPIAELIRRTLAGAGYALAGWPGVAWALAAVTVPCAALLVMTRAGRN